MLRRIVPFVLVATAAAGAVAPSVTAAPPKPKPKPITEKWTAQATPDPTSTNPVSGGICEPTIPTAIFKHPFKAPAAGTLKVSTANVLDWSIAVRNSKNQTLASADGGTPTDLEKVSVKIKKADTMSIDVCNFAGEPTVEVTLTFTYA